MRSSPLAGISAALLLICGCQSTNWTAKNKKTTEPAVVENKVVRDIPWSEWRKNKKDKDQDGKKTQLPAHLQAKLNQSQGGDEASKSAAEWVADGNQLETGRNFEAATKAYEEALRVDPVNADAHHRLGIMADMRQEYGTARDHYEAALRQKSHDANLLSDFGYSMHLQGKAQQSERFLLQSLDIDPQHKQALKNLVTVYAAQNRYEDASQVCRRLRPEAEAQRMLDQGFPKGRGIPDEDSVEVASGRSPRANGGVAVPTDVADPGIKNKSVEEMYQLMAKERQAGIQARQQKSLNEFRPEMQNSLTQEEWGQSQHRDVASNSRQDWAENSASEGRSSSVPAGLEPSARRPSSAETNARNSAASRAVQEQEEVPLWGGAPLQPKVAAAEAPSNSRFGTPGSGGEFGGGRNGISSHGPGSPSGENQGHLMAQASANLRAYQLAMSAGPGTMFPMMPAESAQGAWPSEGTIARPGLDQAPATVGSASDTPGPSQWSSTTTPTGYSETRVTNPQDATGNGMNSTRWQLAPVDVAPRSPSENWNSPSTMPWPEQSAMKSQADMPLQPVEPRQMPRITPGGVNTPTEEYDSAPASFRSDQDQNAEQRPDVVPAWFDSPRQPRGNPQQAKNPKSVQQWPYAPQ